MIATNHALTGAVIGLTVSNPWLAIPAAVVSHLVCDIIPHFGSSLKIDSRVFKTYLLVDALACVSLVGWLFLSDNTSWLLAAVCAFAAVFPDLLWIRRFRLANSGQPYSPKVVETFLSDIQWFEKPIGAVVEAAWLVAGLAVLTNLI